MRERAHQLHRAVAAAAARTTRALRMVVGGRMCWSRSVAVRGRGRAGLPAPTPPPGHRRSRRRQPHALGTSTGVRGHGEAGRAGGTAPTARSQTSPFHIGMGETAKVAGNGGKAPRDGGARDASEVRRGGRASRSAAQHTAAGRRIWTRRASTVTSPLSASRADEKQLSASPEQVRERRAGVGGRCRGRCGKRGRRRGCAAQEGWAATKGDAVVGAHGYATRARASAAALCDGTARARSTARRVTRAPRPRPRLPPPYHAYIPLSGRPEPRRRTRHASRSIIDLVFIYSHRRRRRPSVLLAPSLSFAKTKTEIK